LLVTAVVIAALGAMLVFAYVKQADDRALADQHPVRVLTAKTQIPAGTGAQEAAQSGQFVEKELPRSATGVGALSSIEPIKNSVALTTIFPGQTIVSGMFGTVANASATTPLTLPPGDLAVSVQFSDPGRVAGFVEPGSYVSVFFTLAASAGDAASNGGLTGFTKVLLPKSRVIAVGPTTLSAPADSKQANAEQVPRALITLSLNERDATRIVYASQHGDLYLGLLGNKSKVTAGTTADPTNLF
jgi:pilus assembly protein CpaB